MLQLQVSLEAEALRDTPIYRDGRRLDWNQSQFDSNRILLQGRSYWDIGAPTCFKQAENLLSFTLLHGREAS
ncbi:MAG: hypothetical protein IT305_02015 [Chloroflexi bacterium]|nr:hypothetical protein [Chloroflexota bacterium]